MIRRFLYYTDPVTCLRIWRWVRVPESYVAGAVGLLTGPCVRASALAAGLLAAPLPVPPIPPAWPDFSGPPIDFYGPGFGAGPGGYGSDSYGPLGAFGGGFIGGNGYGHGRSGRGARGVMGGGSGAGPAAGELPGSAVGPAGGGSVDSPGSDAGPALAGTPGDVVPGPLAPAVPDVPQDVPEPKTIGLLLLALAATLGLHTHASGRRA